MKKNILIVILVLTTLIACEEDNSYTSVVGTWQCIEVGTLNTPNPYFVDILRESSDSTILKIDNFYNMGYGKEIFANINGFDITVQSNLHGFSINGTGRVSSDYESIEWEYEVDDGSGNIDYVNANYSRN